jgi:hypothetical protein
VGNSANCCADDLVAIDRDDCVVLIARRENFGQRIDRFETDIASLIPQREEAIRVCGLKTSKPGAHVPTSLWLLVQGAS